MNLHPSFQCAAFDVHFAFADARHCDNRLAYYSHRSSFGALGASHAVAAVLRLRPTACVLKLDSIYGELVALGPAGMGA